MLKKIINSAALASLLMTGAVSAQTTTATTTTPGFPNTEHGFLHSKRTIKDSSFLLN